MVVLLAGARAPRCDAKNMRPSGRDDNPARRKIDDASTEAILPPASGIAGMSASPAPLVMLQAAPAASQKR
jgi:hypothetical protein